MDNYKYKETGLLFKDALLTSEQAHKFLQSHYPKIVACVTSGINAGQAIQKSAPEEYLPLTSCTIACIVNNHMVHYAR